MRRCLQLATFLAPYALAQGCSETILLGSECGDQRGPCRTTAIDASVDPVTMQPKTPPDARPYRDAEIRPPGMDGGQIAPPPPPHDAASEDDLPLARAIRNPSFELDDGGMPGVIAELGLPRTAAIPHWFTCQPLAASNGFAAMEAQNQVTLARPNGTPPDPLMIIDAGPPTIIQPRDGHTFVVAAPLIRTGLLVLPLLQHLKEPLVAFENYAFELDVRATGPAKLVIGGVNGATCSELVPLATADKLEEKREWTPICFELKPDFDFTHLAIRAEFELWSDVSVYFDNLRVLRSCPPRPPLQK